MIPDHHVTRLPLVISGERCIGRLRLGYAEHRLGFVDREVAGMFCPISAIGVGPERDLAGLSFQGRRGIILLPGWWGGLKVSSAAEVRESRGNPSIWLP